MTTGAGKRTSPGSTPRHPRPGIAVLEVVPYLDDIAFGVLDVDREIAARVLDGAGRRRANCARALEDAREACAPRREREVHVAAALVAELLGPDTHTPSRVRRHKQATPGPPRERYLEPKAARGRAPMACSPADAPPRQSAGRSGRRRAAQRSWGYEPGSEASGPCSDGGPNLCLWAGRAGDT
jgi:hypothetical protein